MGSRNEDMGVTARGQGWQSPQGRLRGLAEYALDAAERGLGADDPKPSPQAQERLAKMAKDAIREIPSSIVGARGLFLERLLDDGRAFHELMNIGGAVSKRAMEYLLAVRHAENLGAAAVCTAGENYANPMQNIHETIHDRPDTRQALSAERVAAAKSAGAIRANSLLQSFLIDGVPIAQCTAAKALDYANKKIKEAAWIRVLCADLAPDAVIGEHVDDERAAEIWENVD